MADALTGTSALSNAVQASLDQYVRASLRHMPLLRSVADTRPVQVDKPGSSVTPRGQPIRVRNVGSP